MRAHLVLIILWLAIGSLAHADDIPTEELQRILAAGGAMLLDARPHLEYAISHIPGAQDVAPKAGQPPATYVSDVAEVGRMVNRRKDAPLVIYGNGPFCSKSQRLADELIKDGFTAVRRYQLGIPAWRALGGVTQIELDGARYVMSGDRTAVWIDARPSGGKPTVPGARNIERSRVEVGKDVGELKKAKEDGRLPMNDHNTRIIVFGATVDDARFVAEQIAREAFHNVSFYAGSAAELAAR